LRKLGALDETSPWLGSQVIIPNYVQSAPNCIITTQHYFVCCQNECEGLFGEIETAIGSPAAAVDEILRVVGNMSVQETLDDDSIPELAGLLTTQLKSIASIHGGQVPLHGRLFAQWLHYVFPHHCPFPHKAGDAAVLAPLEFGGAPEATLEEMQRHASTSPTVAVGMPNTVANDSSNLHIGLPEGEQERNVQWMSQWSSEEELIEEHAGELRAPWEEEENVAVAGGMALLVVSLLGFVRFATAEPLKLTVSESHTKQHEV